MAVSLPAEKLKQVKDIISHYPVKKAAIGDVLYLAQEHFGYISNEVELHVAELLELPPAYIHQIVTFYSMYLEKPVGKYLIMLCDNVSCMLCGAETLLEATCNKLDIKPGETTKDGKFTLWNVECLGACELAPAVMINENLHGNMTPEKLTALLDGLE